MRRLTWLLLVLFVFAIPWEYSLDLGAPLGNAARIAGLLVLIAAVPSALLAGRVRTPGAMQWLVLALYLWICCTFLWTIDGAATLTKMRGGFQEFMIVWLIWEFAETPDDLKTLLRAFVAGSWVLAILTLANFSSPQAIAEGQYRFVAYGQDPNDVARFLDLGFPFAALLVGCERRWPARVMAAGYMPLGLAAVLLTASRGGFVAALVAITGSLIILFRGRPRAALGATLALPAVAAGLWFTVPAATFERLATIPAQLRSGDLNQRINIWSAGWRAFVQAPVFGTGAGTFTDAAHLSPIDTAHNTALSLAVSGGLCALFLATAIFALAVQKVFASREPLRLAFGIALLVWCVTAIVASVEESRTTWFLMAALAVGARLSNESPEQVDAVLALRPVAAGVNRSLLLPRISQ
ncbi:MAG TPA: O-antigen ligase family protein [Terracidiphilus sp.]|nr:O-antigen ligase family protein [Terracidiphilus sp.]